MKAKWGIGFVVLILVIGAVFFLKSGRKNIANAPPIADAYLQSLELDKEALSNLKPGDPENDKKIYGSMLRLAETHWPAAREAALKNASSETIYLREGAAQALGYFSDQEANDQLGKLLADPAPTVRDFALKAIGKTVSPERSALLSQYQSQVKGNSSDALAILESEYRLQATSGKGEVVLQKILQMAKNAPEEVSNRASLKLIELAPQWDQTVLLMRTQVDSKKDPGLTAAGVRFLAGRRDPWLKDRWKNLAASPHATVRKAVIQSLHRTCPPDRESILAGIAKEEIDPTVQEVAMEEARLLGESWSQKILEQLKSKAKDPLLKEKLDKGSAIETRPACPSP